MAAYLPFQHPSAPKFPVFSSVPNSIPLYGINLKYSTPCDITEVTKYWPLMFLFGQSFWSLKCWVIKQQVTIHHFRWVLCSSQYKQLRPIFYSWPLHTLKFQVAPGGIWVCKSCIDRPTPVSSGANTSLFHHPVASIPVYFRSDNRWPKSKFFWGANRW